MENRTKKIIHRKKFFSSLGTGLLGFALLKNIPYGLLKATGTDANPVNIKLNPLAVSRNKTRKNNAGK